MCASELIQNHESGRVYQGDVIFGYASLHRIIWHTISEAQELRILSDFNLLGEASAYANKSYLLYGCTYENIQVWPH